MEFKGTLRILLCLILLVYASLLFIVMLDTYNEDFEGKITNVGLRNRGTRPFSAKFSTVFTSFRNVLHSPLMPPPHARKLHAYHTGNEGGDYFDDYIELPKKTTESETLNVARARQNVSTLDHSGRETFSSVDNTDERGSGKGTFWKILSADKHSFANGESYGTNNDPVEKRNGGKVKDNHAETNSINGTEGGTHSLNKVNEKTVISETDYADNDNLVESLEDLDYNWTENQYEYRNFVKHRLFTDLFSPAYIIENAKLCGDNPYIFAFINSRVNSQEIRRDIRQSYIQEFAKNNISYAFIISAPETLGDIQLLKKENDLYGDLIVTSDKEAYVNLTLKTAHLLYWVKKNCRPMTYLAKIDDDVFVNVAKLMEVLTIPRNFTILGKICSSCQPNRGDDYLTLKESMDIFSNVVTRRHMPLLKLPPFAMGPAYVITRDAVEWLLEAAQYLFYFSYEDVFWTGLVVEVINKESGITFDVLKDEREELIKTERREKEANREKDGVDLVRSMRMDSINNKEEEEDENIEYSIKYKYLTIKTEKTPTVTIKRENIVNFRSDRKLNEPLSKNVIAKHSSSVIIHGIQWMKDKAFIDELQGIVNNE